ncbi:MAG: GNAT family N-acetyltransferase [Ruminococcus sp.]|nr:GNAT family N-acetyltransferase [Ruminococcus sp.]
MINFRPVTTEDKSLYYEYRKYTEHRGCEYTFANLLMWGEQSICVRDGMLLRLAYYDGYYSYAFPIGNGDKESAIKAIIEDAKARGIPCTFMGVYEDDIDFLESKFTEKFAYIKARDSFDYVYDIEKLATLKGRKYHSKRNHLHRFYDAYPNYNAEPLTQDNLHLAKELAETWYKEKLEENPDSDYSMEHTALSRVFENYSALEMEGLLLKNGEEVLAFTMGSRMSEDTFDVHFEKALRDTSTAYVAINNEFAKYILNKHPQVRYLDREEDMGLEGLRKAKQSYRPAYLTEKHRAVLINEELKPRCPDESDTKKLWTLWQEAFGDSEDFLRTFWSTAFSPDRCRCITNDKEALAALYILDCSYQGKKLAYIYAVATAKAHRGKGLCTLLMADTHRYLKKSGYTGAVLVPAQESLYSFYENMGYKTCTGIAESEVEAGNENISVTEISAIEYAQLRQNLLPQGAVIQEAENLRFLATYAKFYKGEDFILTASIEDDTLSGIELLGNADKCADIVKALGCKKGRFRAVGKDKPFAMYYSLTKDELSAPSYLGFAFD